MSDLVPGGIKIFRWSPQQLHHDNGGDTSTGCLDTKVRNKCGEDLPGPWWQKTLGF